MEMMIDQMAVQLEFSQRPPAEIVLELRDRPEFSSLRFLNGCAQELKNGVPFPAAWKQAVAQYSSCGPMKKEDIELLYSFGLGLGTTDLSGQKRLCEAHRKRTEQQLESARKQYASKGKLGTVLGTAAGATAVILFI